MTPAPAEIDLHTLHLRIAGLGLQLDFGPGHEALAEEAARLWAHLAADPEAGTVPIGPEVPTTRRTYLVPPEDARAEAARWIADGRVEALGPLLTRPDAVILAPGPGAAYALSGDVTREIIGRLLGTRILLHAGVVAHPQRGVVAMVGASGAGKSTATLTLGREGAYLTDELAIIDPVSRAVTAYAKPVSRISAASGRKQDHALDALGLEPAPGATGIDVLVLLDRAEDASPGLERVPQAEALLALVEQSSSLWAVPHGLASLAEILRRAGGALRARYAEATQLAALLADPPPPCEEAWEEIPVPDLEAPAEGALALAPLAQALAVEDGLVLLAEGRATHLVGLGAVIWEELAAAGSLSIEELEQRVVAFAGPHPDSAAMLAAAVDTLVEDGWIRRG
ncbi:hypothetical protein [Brachybacterium phenoliresistens]|uniref:hypothetical protein n=1 Tax=Brachybacterium phenoliresistens TaxID=396014 RepID=UPI0031D887D1